MDMSPVRVGLSGGIGSGKSTVAKMLEKLGAAVVDADAISRATTAPGGIALPAIVSFFGSEYLDIDGALNRPKMRTTVFHDPAAKSRLEQILHPFIREEMMSQANLATLRGMRHVIFDIPLLIESGVWRNFLDSVLIVDCTPATQKLRVQERSGLNKDMVESIISAQASRVDRLRAADFVVFNDDCSLAQLATSVQAIAAQIGL